MTPVERVLKPEDRIYDLVDLVSDDVPWEGKGPVVNAREWPVNDDIRKIVAEMAERIAREIMPDIAERVIREEIEKLKSAD